MSAPQLPELQRWVLTVMTTPGGVDAGIARAQALHGLSAAQVVATGYGPPPRLRLDIYAQGYLLRLLECLRADFPTLRNTMGEGLFDLFARAYLLHHPSRSTTLFDLGAGFVPFLRSTRPAGYSEPGFDLALDLAALERARTESIRARGVEGESAAQLDPLLLLGGAPLRVAVPESVRLLHLSYPLIPLLEAVARGETQPPIPPARPTWIIIARSHYRVSMHELEPWQWALLNHAQQGAGPLYSGVLAAAEAVGEGVDLLLSRLALWLPLAVALGYLTVAPLASEGSGERPGHLHGPAAWPA